MAAAWQLGPRPHFQYRNVHRARPKPSPAKPTPPPRLRAPHRPIILVFLLICLALASPHFDLFSSLLSASLPTSVSASASNLFSSSTANGDTFRQFDDRQPLSTAKVEEKDVVSADNVPQPVHVEQMQPAPAGNHSQSEPAKDTPPDSNKVQPVSAPVVYDKQPISHASAQGIDVQDNQVKPVTVQAGTSQDTDTEHKQMETVTAQNGISQGTGMEAKQMEPVTAQLISPPEHERQLSLRETLNFTKKTAVNFMHFHKTGGVSFKSALLMFYKERRKDNEDPVMTRDACYVRKAPLRSKSSQNTSFMIWRCDWEPIREMSEDERNKLDFVFGHQFWGDSIVELLNKRDLRTFTIMRHPFDRKVSFYYHFFVRERGRKEGDVSFEEIRDFLLYDKLIMDDAQLGRDLGPNYMAGRVLSNGTQGFIGNGFHSHFAVDHNKEEEVANQAISLIRDYVFVGLQKESSASMCMLLKMMEIFNDVNGVSNDGIKDIGAQVSRLNRGSYSMSAKDIWARLSPEERVVFHKKERVDVSIYEEGERLFRQHVKLFGCAGQLTNSR